MEMNSKAPFTVQSLLKDVSAQMKFIVKTISWQDAQRKSIIEHRVILII